jgi:multidrug efflux pump subunit AcrA (membrane-fusion protein)
MITNHWKRAIVGLVIVATLATSISLLACGNSEESSDSGESQIVEVTRGTLMTQISSFGSISMPEQARLTFGSGGSVNDVYTVSEVNVEFGDNVNEGDVLAKLNTASLERSVTQAESDLRTAQINLEQATSETNLLKAQASVENSEVSLARAEQELDEARNSSMSDAEVDLENARRNLATAQLNAELSITRAEETLENAQDAWGDFVQANIDLLTTIYNSILEQELLDDIEEAGKNLQIARDNAATSTANAEAALIAAENALANAPLDVQQKEASVASAKASLSQAQDDLAYVEAGHDLELLQIKVDNAQVNLDDALDALEAAAIIAPYDGIVASVGADAGDEVTANDVIVHLVNTSVVEIDAAVDEIDVASVEVGQMAMVELDALPDAKLRGEVTAVSPVAAAQSGVVTFDIAVSVQGADQYELKEGMSATITIIALDAHDVLLVPNNAIQRTAEGNVVEVVIGEGETEERGVGIGASNGQQTEIVSGLEEGEQVVVQNSSGDMTNMMENMMHDGRIPGMSGGGMGSGGK